MSRPPRPAERRREVRLGSARRRVQRRRERREYRHRAHSGWRVVYYAVFGRPTTQGGPGCRVYWGSHGCRHPRGHSDDVAHACDCCTCARHPDPDPGNPNSEPSCVAAPPYYGGAATRFYGEDAEALGLPLVLPAAGARKDS